MGTLGSILATGFRDALVGLRAGRSTILFSFVVLSLGLATTTVTFSVVDAVALQPLPFGAPDRLVAVSLPSPIPTSILPATPRDYFDWSERSTAFASLGAARGQRPLRWHQQGQTADLSVMAVTANLFTVLEVPMAAGRPFERRDELAGATGTLILSHATWTRDFGGDPRILGSELQFDDGPREVIGVLPPGVRYPITAGPPVEAYIPYVPTPEDRANGRAFGMFVVGRLKPQMSVEQARADVGRYSSAMVQGLPDQVVGPAKTWLLLLLTAVTCVLLVVAGNVAILLLARAAGRAQEFATRQVLGASANRLAAGLFAEGLIVALASAGAAVLASHWGVAIARANLPRGLTRVDNIAIDARVMFVSLVAAVACCLLFSIAPAWLAVKGDLGTALKSGGSVIVGSRKRDRLLRVFLVSDTALASALLIATALVVSSFLLVMATDLGFDRKDLMFLWFQQSLEGVEQSARPVTVAGLRTDLLDHVKAVPGVLHAAIVDGGTPLSGTRSGVRLVIPGYGETDSSQVDVLAVTADYFTTMGMQLLSGRSFQSSDGPGTALVAVVNDVFARRFLGGSAAAGQVLSYKFPPPGPTTVIGVLKGVRSGGPEAEIRPEIYTLLDQKSQTGISSASLGVITVGGLVIRTRTDVRFIAPAVRDVVGRMVTAVPNPTVFVDDDFKRLTANRRFNAGVMTMFGLIALAIGAVGVYGTMAFLVAQGLPAIGLRLALGATPGKVLREVLTNAIRWVVLGTCAGLLAAFIFARALTSLLFGIVPGEPTLYLLVAAVVVVIGLLGALEPAVRASRVDPLTVLRRN